MVAVLGHLDVVPAGERQDWHFDPFELVEQQGRLYGRGVQDDKGPLLAALFAAKALLDAGVDFKKRLRFIFGTDEENLWRCMKAYVAHEELPTLAFTPDSKFPLIYAEKGLLQVHLKCQNESGIMLVGGTAFNAVPDSILYGGLRREDLAEKLDELGFAYETSTAGIRVIGKAAHVMAAEEGINAIARLAIALQDIGLHSNVIDFIALEVGQDPYAVQIFGDLSDDISGQLKFNVGKINLDGEEDISVDMRIPVMVEKTTVVSKLSQAANRYGLTVQEHDWQPALYIPQDSPLIKKMLAVYADVTGDITAKPEVSGGATYARAIQNCVAFGPRFPNSPITEHKPDEYMDLRDIYLCMEVYAHAIYELTR